MEEIQDTQGALWEVFIQSKKGLPFKHVGSVHAFDKEMAVQNARDLYTCLLYTSPSPRDATLSRMPSSA